MWRYVTQSPQGRNTARVSDRWRVRGGFSYAPGHFEQLINHFGRNTSQKTSVKHNTVVKFDNMSAEAKSTNNHYPKTTQDGSQGPQPHNEPSASSVSADMSQGEGSTLIVEPFEHMPIRSAISDESLADTNLAQSMGSESSLHSLNAIAGLNADQGSQPESDDVSDPLFNRPRLSTRIWCFALAALFFAAACALWWVAVRTVSGQSYEEMVIQNFNDYGLLSEFAFLLRPLRNSLFVIIISAMIAVCALSIAVVRKRWWLIGQCVAFATVALSSDILKRALPRPMLVHIASLGLNSAPSGHILLISCACAMLVCCVSRAWRAWTALLAVLATMLVADSLIAGQWHRPADIIISMLIVGAVMLVTLGCTRASGMDRIGDRRSSISVQIIGSSMISLGLMALLYGTYLVWQILPGIELSANWTRLVACVSTHWLITGTALLVFGVLMVLRQSSAAPLSRLGLVGAPPTPPPASH